RPGLVHRLDMETSGLLVVAKSDKSLSFLADEMKERRIKRKYIAFVWGHMPEEEGRIDAPIGRSRKDRKKMTVTNMGSREAVTKYRVLTKYLFADKLELQLQTGRTHQIRVHLLHIGHPVIGDPDYGGREKAMTGIFDQYRKLAAEILKATDRQALHAYKLSFKHPSTNLEMSFESQLPDDMKLVEELLTSEARTR
ncbi:MAG: RluA family pseudouridine synthase, partial [candidate division Zixibacteria bacterium]|nr:RluA family pseudouridine synthase [candidate division Zixibacteria bacterium]